MFGNDLTEGQEFSGHFFQDMAAKEDMDNWLIRACAPLLDCMMSQHKLDNEIHRQRRSELLKIEKRTKVNLENK